MNCKKCNCFFEPTKGLINYCSLKCRNSRVRDIESRNRTSIAMINSDKVKAAHKIKSKNQIGKQIVKRINKVCTICNKDFLTTDKRNRKYHSECFLKANGGLREGSGRGKSGWYKGYWCDSSYELAYVIYNLDHGIKFERNKESFKYKHENKIFNYYPDFKIENTYIEIKGYKDSKFISKTNQFPYKLKILFEEDLKKEFEYVIKNYGRDYIKNYDNKTTTCETPVRIR